MYININKEMLLESYFQVHEKGRNHKDYAKNISSGQTAKGLLTKFEQPVQNSLVVQKNQIHKTF